MQSVKSITSLRNVACLGQQVILRNNLHHTPGTPTQFAQKWVSPIAPAQPPPGPASSQTSSDHHVIFQEVINMRNMKRTNIRVTASSKMDSTPPQLMVLGEEEEESPENNGFQWRSISHSVSLPDRVGPGQLTALLTRSGNLIIRAFNESPTAKPVTHQAHTLPGQFCEICIMEEKYTPTNTTISSGRRKQT